jgi:Heavy metal associated domain 2
LKDIEKCLSCTANVLQMDYQFIHSIPGRFRILIPQLATDPDYARQLQGFLESINFVTEVRINMWAQSLVVSYKTNTLSTEAVQKQLVKAIEKADPSTTSPAKKTLTPIPFHSVMKPTINRENSKTSKAIVGEQELSSTPRPNPIVDDPWDSDLKAKPDSFNTPIAESASEEQKPKSTTDKQLDRVEKK